MIRQSLANQASGVRAKLLRGAERILREQGASLFVLKPVIQLGA